MNGIIGDFIGSKINEFLLGLWSWIMAMSYWITTFICIFCIIYYVVNKTPRPMRILGFTLVTYILLKGIDTVI